MFDAKIERAGGLLTVTLKSEPLEALMKSLSSDRKEQIFWGDGTVQGPGLEAALDNLTRWAVKPAKLQPIAAGAGVAVNSNPELISDSGRTVSLIPLTLKGLGQGLTIRPAVPYHVDHLKLWAKNIAEVAHALLVSVQPVIITVSVRPPGAPTPRET